jgi:hypothetical protein
LLRPLVDRLRPFEDEDDFDPRPDRLLVRFDDERLFDALLAEPPPEEESSSSMST